MTNRTIGWTMALSNAAMSRMMLKPPLPVAFAISPAAAMASVIVLLPVKNALNHFS
jgi:hypothetical protein